MATATIPSGPRARRAFAILGLIMIAAWCLLCVVDGSGQPSGYREYRRSTTGFEYPVADVAFWSTFIMIELAATLACLWRASSVPVTCGLLAVAFGVGMFGVGAFAMHAPPAYGGHLAFLGIGAAWLVLSAVVTGMAGLVLGARLRRPGRSVE